MCWCGHLLVSDHHLGAYLVNGLILTGYHSGELHAVLACWFDVLSHFSSAMGRTHDRLAEIQTSATLGVDRGNVRVSAKAKLQQLLSTIKNCISPLKRIEIGVFFC